MNLLRLVNGSKTINVEFSLTERYFMNKYLLIINQKLLEMQRIILDEVKVPNNPWVSSNFPEGCKLACMEDLLSFVYFILYFHIKKNYLKKPCHIIEMHEKQIAV